MESRNPEFERARKETILKIIKEADEKHPSPDARANAVYHWLARNDFTVWDIICFCGEYLGMMSAAYPFIEEDSKKILTKIHAAHYKVFEADIELESRIKSTELPVGDRKESNSTGTVSESGTSDGSESPS